jgi:hypothetical protein
MMDFFMALLLVLIFFLIYLVRRKLGQSVKPVRFFVGNQRSAEAFGFLMLTLKKVVKMRTRPPPRSHLENCGGIA